MKGLKWILVVQKIGDLYLFHRNYSWHLAYQYGYTCFYCLDPIVLTIPLLICTWFLKNQFGIIKFDVQVYFKLDFYCLFRLQKSSSSKLIFTTWFFKNKVQINRGYEQPLKFLFFWLPCVCLGDLGASVRFSTVSSTKRSSNLSVHKVSILSWSLFFWKRLYKKIRFILINKCEGRTKPLRVPSALWLPNSFP